MPKQAINYELINTLYSQTKNSFYSTIETIPEEEVNQLDNYQTLLVGYVLGVLHIDPQNFIDVYNALQKKILNPEQVILTTNI